MASRKNSDFNKINIQYCKYCGKGCKNLNSLSNHERLCKLNPNHQESPLIKYHSEVNNPWNKGLTKDTDERIAKSIETYHQNFLDGKHKSNSHKHTQETKKKLSENALKNNWENHFGSHKSYEYCGIKFVSSYEVKVAEELDKNNIKWVKPSRLSYTDTKGKLHHYTADFYLPDYKVYLDPKNDYLIENINPTLGYSDSDKIKWVEEQNNVTVVILDKNHLDWNNIKLLL